MTIINIYEIIVKLENGKNIWVISEAKKPKDPNSISVIWNKKQKEWQFLPPKPSTNRSSNLKYNDECDTTKFQKIQLREHVNYIFHYLGKQSEEFNEFQKKIEASKNILVQEVVSTISKTQSLETLLLINFKNYTGSFPLYIEGIEDNLPSIEVIPNPKKISLKDYELMIEKISSFIGNLVFQSNHIIFNKFIRKYQAPKFKNLYQDYLSQKAAIIKSFFSTLSKILEQIKRNPHSQLISVLKMKDLNKLRKSDKIDFYKSVRDKRCIQKLESGRNTQILSKIRCSRPSGLIDVYCISKLHIQEKTLTTDTNENRFIKFFLHRLSSEINHPLFQEYFNKRDLKKYRNFLNYNLNSSFFREIGRMKKIPFNSQIIAKKHAYRQIFDYYLMLENPTLFNFDGLFNVSFKPIDKLYEYYCLIIFLEILGKITGYDYMKHLDFEKDIKIKLTDSKGKLLDYLEIEFMRFYFQINDIKIELIFSAEKKNINLKSYSLGEPQKPDFILTLYDMTNKPLKFNYKETMGQAKIAKFIFDSKYSTDLAPSLNKMHSYHDKLKIISGAYSLQPISSEIYNPNKNIGKIFSILGKSRRLINPGTFNGIGYFYISPRQFHKKLNDLFLYKFLEIITTFKMLYK